MENPLSRREIGLGWELKKVGQQLIAHFSFVHIRQRYLIAVCIYRHVITFELCVKYDVDGHYSRFAARILANPRQYDITLLC